MSWPLWFGLGIVVGSVGALCLRALLKDAEGFWDCVGYVCYALGPHSVCSRCHAPVRPDEVDEHWGRHVRFDRALAAREKDRP